LPPTGRVAERSRPAARVTKRDRDWPSGRHPGYRPAPHSFTHDFAVPFTNNPCEQPQRMVKLHVKIGGCRRSVRTAARYCLVRSYLTTARHHAIHALAAIRDALTGNPGCRHNHLINHRPEWIRATDSIREPHEHRTH
jgi:hypothetical protein